MTDSTVPTQAVAEEQASLYVLDLMDTKERRSCERRLNSDADLRRCVHGLRAALEAEVFIDPAPSAPSRVWGKILERTRKDGARLLPFPKAIRRWIPQVAAMAACLALGAFLHVLWSRGGGSGLPGSRLARDLGAQGTRPVRGGATGASVAGFAEASPTTSPLPQRSEVVVDEAPGSQSSTAEVVEGLEARNAALQGKIRGLTVQVAELGQQVQQLSLIPSGVSRIHVFTLGLPTVPPSTSLATVDAPNRTNSLAESLARLAGERMALALNTPSTAASVQDLAARSVLTAPGGAASGGGTEAVGKVALVPAQPATTEPGTPSAAGANIASVSTADSPGARSALVAGNPTSTLAPIVFSAPDLGVHALAVPTAPPGGQYQLWSRGSDGTVSSLGVLPPSSSPVSVVTFERGTVEGLFMSFEPVGGSFQPTGPVVGSGQNPVLPGLGKP